MFKRSLIVTKKSYVTCDFHEFLIQQNNLLDM